MRKVINHYKTVSTHRKAVRKLMFKLGPKFYIQGLTHDLSKYSPSEFGPSVKYWNGKYSPTVNERKDHGYSGAWLHHKGRNRHHFEYWVDYSEASDTPKPVIMPPKYFCEMVCDRIAACKTYQKDKYTDASPYIYFDERTRTDKGMHKVVKKALERCLYYLKEKGEDEFFKELRAVYERFGNKGTLMYSMINFENSQYFRV